MHLMKKVVAISILALITAASGCCCCCCDFTSTPTPAPGGDDYLPSDYAYGSYYQSDPGPSAEDHQKSQAAIDRAADALDSVDKAAFLECLTAGQKSWYDTADMSPDGARNLAAALRSAQVSRQYSNEIVYETSVNGESLYFSTTKEGGQWKLDNI